jgi:hypothetical protein
MIEFLKSLLSAEGNISSKRLMAIGLIISGIGAGASLLGLAAITKS